MNLWQFWKSEGHGWRYLIPWNDTGWTHYASCTELWISTDMHYKPINIFYGHSRTGHYCSRGNTWTKQLMFLSPHWILSAAYGIHWIPTVRCIVYLVAITQPDVMILTILVARTTWCLLHSSARSLFPTKKMFCRVSYSALFIVHLWDCCFQQSTKLYNLCSPQTLPSSNPQSCLLHSL